MPHCITSETLEQPLTKNMLSFDGKNYNREMTSEKFEKVQTFSSRMRNYLSEMPNNFPFKEQKKELFFLKMRALIFE